MDVNSVLQSTRQYFQGVPSSSPATGELAPGASVGYSSPPVSSTATSVAPSAAFAPYPGNHYPTSSWSSQSTSQQNAYHYTPSTISASNGQPRYTQSVVSAPYHYYENARSQKALPSTSNSYAPQHNYMTPSITRLKEGVNNQGMFNMDSIVCQPNATYIQGVKKTKMKPSLSAPSPANVYKQPTQLEQESRYYNNHHGSQPASLPLQPATAATHVPAVIPQHATPNHQLQRAAEQPSNQLYSHQSVIEQRVGIQQQVSYQSTVSIRAPVDKAREPVDARYYVNRRLEAATMQSPTITKRDSPLDLSVKTIRQSADSTAHDDAENSMYNHHLQNAPWNTVAPHQMRPAEARHPHMPPQLPYANLATAAVSLPNVHNHSNSAFSATQRQPHYPPANPSPAVYTPQEPPYRVNNGQMQDDRHPIPEYRNEKMTFSFTYEQKHVHRTQVSATTRFSQYYQNDTTKKTPQVTQPYMNQVPSPQVKPPQSSQSRKRRPFSETPAPTPPPIKNPRMLSIDKEIDNRLQAYTKAREEEKKATREPNKPEASVLRSNLEKDKESLEASQFPRLPFTKYLEQKAQHKLPVQPVQAYPHQQWYQRSPNQHPSQHKPPQRPEPPVQDGHAIKFNKTNFESKDLRIIEKIENLKTEEQRPLPPFRAFSMQPPTPYMAETEQKFERREVDVATPPRKVDLDESQSRAALMASARAHPRIRTKAELKQVTPVDKSKDKVSVEPAKLPDAVQTVQKSRSPRHEDNQFSKHFTTEDRSNGNSGVKDIVETLMKDQYESYYGKPYQPRLHRSKENSVNVHRSSSETTVFDFRSDSEPESNPTDSLNNMRKDRKKTPSATPTIEQMQEDYSDDSQWLEACDELIQQFSNGGQKKRGRKKKPCKPVDDEPTPEKEIKEYSDSEMKKKIKVETDSESASEDEKPLTVDKIKKESRDDEFDDDIIRHPTIRVKRERIESDTDEEPVKVKQECKDKVNVTLEIRGQRSNVSTTRIRIQNSLEDSSDTDTDDSFTFVPKKVPIRKPKVLIKKKKIPMKSKIVTRKKGKNIDPKREKMRHMILRRMETRKSKMDAIKAKKAKVDDEEPQPRITRKMTRRECQKIEDIKKKANLREKPKYEEKSKKEKSDKDDKRAKLDRQSKDDKSRAKPEEKSKNDKSKQTKPEEKSKLKTKDEKPKSKEKINDENTKTKIDDKAKPKDKNDNSKLKSKDDKTKKPIKKEPKPDPKDKQEDVTRRSLRSRNVIVINEKSDKSPKKPVKKIDTPKEKTKSPLKPKSEPKNEEKPILEVKEKLDIKPSWEEELFNYKYSLRMPVKLINIAKPPNWPKNNGGASSLPDLDRSESDSDLLNECTKTKSPKKKNKDEAKVSNTKEFKDSVKFLKEKFDKKIEEKNKATSLTQLMIEKKIKIIPKSSDGPELLPTPSLDSFRSKINSKNDSPKKNDSRRKNSNKGAEDDDKDEIVEDSLIGYFRKETVDVFKEVFEKHKVPNQFKTVILESRTRTQTKEMKQNATLKQVFGCDRPASAPPVTDSIDEQDKKVKNSTNGCLKPLHNKSFAKFKLLMDDSCHENEKNSKDFEDTVDTVDFICNADDSKDNIETEIENVVKRKTRRKCRSSGFDYIRKKKKIKKEEDEESIEEKERKKAAAPIRPTLESIEDIQNEIRSWVVNKGIGETVLHKAARLGYSDISSYCLEKLNSSPSASDNAGYTPLHEACTRGHLKIAKMLLKYGADVSASAKGGIRPLHEAVEHGNVELVRLLLAYGADPLLSTYAGQTPLSLVKEEEDELREFILLYLADIQGTPSKPWSFLGYDDNVREPCGYDPLRDSPPPSPEQMNNFEFEMSDTPLPNLYRLTNEPDLWILCSDLPARIRDSIVKRTQDQSPSQFTIKKIGRTEFDENVESASFLENKFSQKSNKCKANTYTMVKYNDKLLAALNIQKLTMSFS